MKEPKDPCSLILWLSKKLKRNVQQELISLCHAHRLYVSLNVGTCPCVREVLTGEDTEYRWSAKCCKLTYLLSVLQVVRKEAAELEPIICEYSFLRPDGSCRTKRRQMSRRECLKTKQEIQKANAECSWFSRVQIWFKNL